jgi:L-glyceraldehyde 3-phosphate reductase
MTFQPSQNRHEKLPTRRCGQSGLHLPLLSLGLWHNFGEVDSHATAREILLHAFDNGITHFDLANNYGPPPGSAEETLGRVLVSDLAPYRDELIISTKAGYRMWPGPHGEWGSRKSLLGSLDRSLARMKLEFVDIFYSHRPDPETPMEETMGALDHAVRSGKALYAGISNYDPVQTSDAARILQKMGTPFVIHQVRYNLFERQPELGLFRILRESGIGCIVFSPLAQGLLSHRYETDQLPEDSRAAKSHGFLKPQAVEERRRALHALREVARERGQTLAQMALAWTLRDPVVTSSLIGVSRVAQLDENLQCFPCADFTPSELAKIDTACANSAGTS